MLIALIVALLGLIIIGLIVFGGGQVFIPIFRSLWQLLAQSFGASIDNNQIETAITISNSTPGVVSTKFAFLTGYMISNGHWTGWLAMFLTYLFFALPSILIMYWAGKVLKSNNQSIILTKILTFTKPVIGGIMISLAIQLLLGVMLPQLVFNKSDTDYLNWSNDVKEQFFVGWRFIALLVWVPINLVISFILCRKNFSIFFLFMASIIFSLILFQPWL